MAKFVCSLFCVIITYIMSSTTSGQLLSPYINARYNALQQGTRTTDEHNPANETITPPQEQSTVAYSYPNQCICSEVYDPICASNDRSYFNMCQMECEVGPNSNVTVAYQGNCIPF